MSRQLLTGKRRNLSAQCALLAGAAALMLPAPVFISATAHAQSTTLPPVEVMQKKPKPAKTVKKAPQKKTPAVSEAAPPAEPSAPSGLPASGARVSGDAIAAQKPATNDTASLLGNTPGVSLYTGGGVSSLPSIHGMEDDRVKVMLNGMIISSACANHMNPPLSYVDPAQVKKIDVFAGITPVSVGGDSIGGTIAVETLPPQFAAPGEGVVTHGSLSGFVRSNTSTIGGSATASAATSNFAIGYTGAWSKAESYHDGNGNKILGSLYEAQNQALTLAARKNGDLFVIEAGLQHIPYQGFPNQQMDMVKNDAWYINGRYEGMFNWGKLDLKSYYHNVEHGMNILPERSSSQMPMNNTGEDYGYQIKAEIPVSRRDTIRIGNEFHRQTLDDWWPKTAPWETMDFINVNGGVRDRLGTFAEWEAKWDRHWSTLIGVRNDVVWTDTGPVHGSADMPYYTNWSVPFNAMDRSRTDVNFDMTALTRYQPNAASTYELGYSRKTRSPSLYERYIWWDYSNMNGWFGDNNAYHGNPDLKPEVAHTISFTAGWNDPARKDWEVKVTPYYTYVQDYIDVDQDPARHTNINWPGGKAVARLMFNNHDAELYGADVSGRFTLLRNAQVGRLALTGVLGYVHGTNLDTGDNLYHMMPLNAKLALEHKAGGWTNVAELQLVAEKTDVQEQRMEPLTPGYALVNLRSSYEWQRVRLDLGVSNLFDQQYYHPLGGVYVDKFWNGVSYPNSVPGYSPLPGEGRSFYAGLTVKF